ncbi:MAG: DUF5682 family protein [Clostridium sp.]|nr:DUF5682 family protein [Clostridium sp.]MCM1207663.1 DUF5682 family protein [Ruminococcus sp.]
MGEILRGETLAEVDKMVSPAISDSDMERICEDAFSLDHQVIYFPIRHHSPACAYHLQQVIAGCQPDCILIEGPAGANDLIPVMADAETEAPFAVYYSYKDSEGIISEDKGQYRCYYPFLDYSPELVAVRAGVGSKIHTEFIDLPYAEILAASEENAGLRKNEEKNNYNDDYYLSTSTFMKKLVEKSGFRSFDELWEKYFELDGMFLESSAFVGNMLYYCVLSRLTSKESGLLAEGCFAREAYMRQKISDAKKKFQKIVVVTGGFHTYGLLYGQEQYSLHNIKKENQGVYVMPYSMEATDGLNGYASGMPFPAFYQSVWERLQNSLTKENETTAESDRSTDKAVVHSTGDCIGNVWQIYRDVVLQFLVSTGKSVRKKTGSPSTYDEICALNMAENLASLRGKKCIGAYELWDSVLSSYVKGEYTRATDLPMRTLRTGLTGKAIGKLCKDAKMPPLVHDFNESCRKHRLKVGSTVKTEVVLNIFSSEKHRTLSEFFHQMDYLATDFAVLVKGPRLTLRKDRNLIREVWSYKWSTQVIASLIASSVYGGTLPEAALSKIKSELKTNVSGAKASECLIRMFEMGLDSKLGDALARLERILLEDDDFFSLAKTFSNLIMVDELSGLYRSDLDVTGLTQTVYRKLVTALPHMAEMKDEAVTEAMEALKTLFTILDKDRYKDDRQMFVDALYALVEKEKINPNLLGCSMGILYGLGCMDTDVIGRKCAGFLAGTGEKQLEAAGVFRGLFFAARDLLLVGDEYIKIIDAFIGRVDDAQFMQMLPQLRIAFGYFTPTEIEKIGGVVAGMYGMQKQEFNRLADVTPEQYQYGVELDQYVVEMMKQYE